MAETAIRRQNDLFIDPSYKEYVYRNDSGKETYNNRRSAKGIQFRRKVGIITYKTQKARRALEVIEAETKLKIEIKLVTGIKTLLNTISITLQIKRENNKEGLSKQSTNTTLPPVQETEE